VPDDDEQAFAAAVATVLRDAGVRTRLAAEAVEHAKTWTAPATARRLEAFYRDVLERTTAVAASRTPFAGPPLAR
jgi:glycosyltransferase involved in cell wall biosynthesis